MTPKINEYFNNESIDLKFDVKIEMYGTGIDLSDESGHTTERDERSGGAVPKAAEAV